MFYSVGAMPVIFTRRLSSSSAAELSGTVNGAPVLRRFTLNVPICRFTSCHHRNDATSACPKPNKAKASTTSAASVRASDSFLSRIVLTTALHCSTVGKSPVTGRTFPSLQTVSFFLTPGSAPGSRPIAFAVNAR